MSKFTDEERAATLAEARANIEFAKNLQPRDNVLADFESFVRSSREPPPEPPPEPETRSLEAEINAVIAAVAADTEQQIEQHRKFVFDVIEGVIVETQRRQAAAIAAAKEEIKGELAAALRTTELLRLEVSQLRLEIARLTAEGVALNGRSGVGLATVKH